jgi:branched-chain amino acid transport system ATP-binding protein
MTAAPVQLHEAPAKPSILTVSGLTAGYGDVQVLWGIDLAVPEGEIV